MKPKVIDLPNEAGFITLTWTSISFFIQGLGLYFGWMPDLELTLFSLTLMEWREDDKGDYWGMTVCRLQILYFYFALTLNK
jgi:hypothetical protein